MAPSLPRPRVEDLLAYDLAVCAWMDRKPGGEGVREIPFEPADVGSDGVRRQPPDARFSLPRIAGFDEAGRGALAGPVAVGCVAFDLRVFAIPLSRRAMLEDLFGLDDSKRLTPRRRERLLERIMAHAAWSVGYASASEIDRIGIVPACRLAADRAYRGLGLSIDVALLDRGLALGPGSWDPQRKTPDRPREATATGADGRSLHVAAASIVAKVTRDRMMQRLESRFPGYDLGRHKGYGTAAHREAIRALGPARIHRRSFALGSEGAKSQFC